MLILLVMKRINNILNTIKIILNDICNMKFIACKIVNQLKFFENLKKKNLKKSCR